MVARNFSRRGVRGNLFSQRSLFGSDGSRSFTCSVGKSSGFEEKEVIDDEVDVSFFSPPLFIFLLLFSCFCYYFCFCLYSSKLICST